MKAIEKAALYQPLDNLFNCEPLRRPLRAEIVRRGEVMATLYCKHHETREHLENRASRMAALYGGEMVMYEA
ncbi:hypothetical protein QPM17_00480 [Marinobacter sp. TBZ242]|uniref:Uncharacterized protein n=1 Tax=Marinobacter azerbaijanicus TaxID=3050455 RepID=A0ABT7I667_9GAMM|nr:hypothetical protein [Marinobacter sp. TBZ242]MDL0429587.1 hypothetical protein [Marinobacter sp. TBZ242]